MSEHAANFRPWFPFALGTAAVSLCLAFLPAPAPMTADELAEVAVAYYKLRAPQAQPAFDAALAIDPKHRRANFGAGLAAIESGRMPDAEAYLKKGLEAAPGDQEISLSLAALYQTSGRFEEAKTLYTQLGERFPGDSRIVYNRALMALKMQQFAEAVTLFEKYLDMPGAYQKRGSVARTVEQLRQQLQMPPPKWAKK